jgi:hypothetical protein
MDPAASTAAPKGQTRSHRETHWAGDAGARYRAATASLSE